MRYTLNEKKKQQTNNLLLFSNLATLNIEEQLVNDDVSAKDVLNIFCKKKIKKFCLNFILIRIFII